MRNHVVVCSSARGGACRLRTGIAESRGEIVVTAGVPFNMPGTTNILRVAWVEE